MTTNPVKTTQDAITFLAKFTEGCHMRGIEWWYLNALGPTKTAQRLGAPSTGPPASTK